MKTLDDEYRWKIHEKKSRGTNDGLPLSKGLTTLEVIMSAGQNSQKVLSKKVMDHIYILQKNGFDGA